MTAPASRSSPVPPIETDALVIGAGPVGLFQVFQLGLLEIGAHVVDALPHAGGQCVELYGDKPIYDIPGIQVCTGRELADRLLAQIAPFRAPLHLGEVVASLRRQPCDGRFRVETRRSGGGGDGTAASVFLARTVFVAAGVGAFLPRQLKVDGIDRFEGSQLFYRMPEDDAANDDASPHFAQRDLVVLGGDEAALDAALRFAERARGGDAFCHSVTLLHRRDVLDASAEKIERMKALCDRRRMHFVVGQITGFDADASGRLAALRVTGPDAQTRTLAADALLVLLGLSPKLGPIADWGLALERKQLRVDAEAFQTNVPGIFAVGDVNTYPGKKKLIVCGFHEATLAAWGAAALVHPERRLTLQYTTTSPRLHELLGVAPRAH